MKFGRYKYIDGALNKSARSEGKMLQYGLDRYLSNLRTWTPSSRIEVVQACNIARHLVSTGDMPAEERELVLACLHGLIRGVRTRYAPTALALRLLPETCRSAEGFEREALAAVARSAEAFRDEPCKAPTA